MSHPAPCAHARLVGLIGSDFGSLEVEGEVLKDPTKVGVGISPFYRTQMV